jgi:hypothetical protein
VLAALEAGSDVRAECFRVGTNRSRIALESPYYVKLNHDTQVIRKKVWEIAHLFPLKGGVLFHELLHLPPNWAKRTTQIGYTPDNACNGAFEADTDPHDPLRLAGYARWFAVWIGVISVLVIVSIYGDIAVAEDRSNVTTTNKERVETTMAEPAQKGTKVSIETLLSRIESLEAKVIAIERRNRRVEADKAWETSYARMLLIAVITYILASLVLWIIQVQNPHLGALIPTLGYALSTLTLSAGKEIWIKYFAGL